VREGRDTPRPQVSSMQIVFGSILAISLLLAINFSGRIAAGRSISAERGVLENLIATEQYRATQLHNEFNYVMSDGFVNQWARGEGKMIKINEVLIVPVPGNSTPVPTATPFAPLDAPDEEASTNWQLWWQLFFDTIPPDLNSR
jgi:hypothetical protein